MGYQPEQIEEYLEQLKLQQSQPQGQKSSLNFNNFLTKPKKKKDTTQQKTKKIIKKKEEAPKVIEFKQEKLVAEDLQKIPYDRTKYEVVDESRAPLNIVFIGHVDAGKSTICGQVLLLAGEVDLNELRKYEIEAKEKNRESWYLAYIMDQGEEEKEKGKTVEVGKAFFQTKNRRFTIIDAPGHKNYVPNMIQGTSQADVGCLVISAKEGEFESGFDKGGQTREHALLAKSIGIRHLIILINKMDETNWNRERYTFIMDQMKPFLAQAGYNVDKQVSWCPISGLVGENMKVPVSSKNAEWYRGDCFFEMLDDLSVPNRDSNGPLRIPVLDRIRDQGLFLTGKIEQGCIKVDHHVQIMPLNKIFSIVAIIDNRDRNIYYAKAGENIRVFFNSKIKVKGLEDEDIKKGFMVCSINETCYVTQEIEAEVQLLNLPAHKSILSVGYQCILHMHSAIEEVIISSIIYVMDDGKKNANCTFLTSNKTALVRIRCDNMLCLEKFIENPVLGSFTLRDEGLTIAMGKVMRLKPIKSMVAMQQSTVQSVQQIEEKPAQKAQVVIEQSHPDEPEDSPF